MIRFLRFLPRRWWSVRAWQTWGSYVHWRLETYGVFYPAGKTNWKAMGLLLRQFPSYMQWVQGLDVARGKNFKQL